MDTMAVTIIALHNGKQAVWKKGKGVLVSLEGLVHGARLLAERAGGLSPVWMCFDKQNRKAVFPEQLERPDAERPSSVPSVSLAS